MHPIIMRLKNYKAHQEHKQIQALLDKQPSLDELEEALKNLELKTNAGNAAKAHLLEKIEETKREAFIKKMLHSLSKGIVASIEITENDDNDNNDEPKNYKLH